MWLLPLQSVQNNPPSLFRSRGTQLTFKWSRIQLFVQMFIIGICWRHFALGRIRPIAIFLKPLNCKTKPLSPFKGNLVKILNLLLLPPWLFKDIPRNIFLSQNFAILSCKRSCFFSACCCHVLTETLRLHCVFLTLYVVLCRVLCFSLHCVALCCVWEEWGAFLPGINNPLPAAASGGMRGRILKSFKPFLQW